MSNCYKVFVFGRLEGIFGRETQALAYIAVHILRIWPDADWKLESAYVEGAGF